MDGNTLALLAIAAFNALTAALVYLNSRYIREVKHATNSMKDALVETTARASHAAGREEMRIEQARKGD